MTHHLGQNIAAIQGDGFSYPLDRKDSWGQHDTPTSQKPNEIATRILTHQEQGTDSLPLRAPVLAKANGSEPTHPLMKVQQDAATTSIAPESVVASPENLDHFALKLGYGYKAANLMVMQSLASEISKELKTCDIKVPPFLPIGDFEMSRHLCTHVPKVFTLWKEFLDTFDPAIKKQYEEKASDEEAGRVPIKISERGRMVLVEISQIITDHLKQNPYITNQLEEWLKKENPEFIIVRSSGKEDSDTNSNAGGNESIPYVKPEPRAVSEALGEVIASYFGAKSIGQRLLAGDRSLFRDPKPFIPALLQVMVGEKIGAIDVKHDEIPRSGVLFTRESDKAEGVTLFQAGLGNNKGVVDSQVGVDSYYVKEGNINAVVREKRTRFVSVQGASGKYDVVPIRNNNRSLELSQTLPVGVIHDLKRIANKISDMYGTKAGKSKPMDMEYTVKLKEKGHDKPVIYILQARPLLGTRGKANIEHTYLDLKNIKQIGKENVVAAATLLDGNAYVRKITDPSKIVFVDDLSKGLEAYNPNIDVIVLKKTALATSHPAIFLRPKGVAVLIVSDVHEFALWKAKASKASQEQPLLVDTQRGLLVSCSQGKNVDAMIKKGLVSYPIPLEVTVPPSTFVSHNPDEFPRFSNVIKMRLEHFNQHTNQLIDTLRGHKELLPVKGTHANTLRDLFDIMATGDTVQANLALATVLNVMKKRLVKSMKETDDFRASINKPLFQVFEAAIRHAEKELLPAIAKYPPQSLERLYPIKFLDAMLMQKYAQHVMGSLSYAQVLENNKNQKAALAAASQNGLTINGTQGQELIALMQQKAHSYSEECSKNWIDLLKEITQLPPGKKSKAIKTLLSHVINAGQIHIGSLWMNIVFNEGWKHVSAKGQSGEGRISNLFAFLKMKEDESQHTQQWILEHQLILNGVEEQEALWADPKHVRQYAAKLRLLFLEELGFDRTGLKDNSLRKLYEKSPPLGKLSLLQYIRGAVDIYDRTIKSVKGSTEFADERDKAVAMAELLQGYFEMMEACMKILDINDETSLQAVTLGDAVYFKEYIQFLKQGKQCILCHKGHYKTTGFDQLTERGKSGAFIPNQQFQARPEFNVASLVIGSHAHLHYGIHWPTTLEEYFTTFHQNMEGIVKYLLKKNGMTSDLLAELPRKLCHQITTCFKQDISYMGEEEGKMHIGYQIPLNEHAGLLLLKYDPAKPDRGVEVEVNLCGGDEHRRWDQAAAFGALLAYTIADGFSEGTAPTINYEEPCGVQFTLHMQKDFIKEERLFSAIWFVMKYLTMHSAGKPEQWSNNLVLVMDKIIEGRMGWEHVKPECFENTLFVNGALMRKFKVEGKNTLRAQVAISSFRGLACRNLSDYSRENPEGLVKEAISCLEEILRSDLDTAKQIKGDVEKLILDADMKKTFPEICTRLAWVSRIPG